VLCIRDPGPAQKQTLPVGKRQHHRNRPAWRTLPDSPDLLVDHRIPAGGLADLMSRIAAWHGPSIARLANAAGQRRCARNVTVTPGPVRITLFGNDAGGWARRIQSVRAARQRAWWGRTASRRWYLRCSFDKRARAERSQPCQFAKLGRRSRPGPWASARCRLTRISHAENLGGRPGGPG